MLKIDKIIRRFSEKKYPEGNKHDIAGKDIQEVESTINFDLISKFEKYIEVQKPYLDSKLTIEKLAEAIGTNRTYISAIIKEKTSLSFRDYINNLRIEKAKENMEKRPREVLSKVAENSGFASDAQLIRKFKQIEGVTPKEWIKQQRTK